MQWHQLDHMQTICTSLQTGNHTNTSSLNFYRLDALPVAQPTASKHFSVTAIDNRYCIKKFGQVPNVLLEICMQTDYDTGLHVHTDRYAHRNNPFS